MRVTVGFVFGLLTGLAIWRGPSLTAGMWTSIPPADPLDYEGPRTRYWNGGKELPRGEGEW